MNKTHDGAAKQHWCFGARKNIVLDVIYCSAGAGFACVAQSLLGLVEAVV
jgi:uncharacterized membrane protein